MILLLPAPTHLIQFMFMTKNTKLKLFLEYSQRRLCCIDVVQTFSSCFCACIESPIKCKTFSQVTTPTNFHLKVKRADAWEHEMNDDGKKAKK